MVSAFNLIAIVSAARSLRRSFCPGGNFNQRKLKHKPGQVIPGSSLYSPLTGYGAEPCRMKVKRSSRHWAAMKLKAVSLSFSLSLPLSLSRLVHQSIAGIIFILLPASPRNRTNCN